MPNQTRPSEVGVDCNLARPKPQTSTNQSTYKASGIVKHYAQLKALQPAEQTILDAFQTRLPTMKMLDLGIGGGRTTLHFANLVKEYVGVDYSEEMIEACNQRFTPRASSVSFEVCDAREMSRFKDESFDFILFSFNGIDYISHCDRLKVFQEIQRVGKSGGYFVFSSHNLQGMEREYDFSKQFSCNPLTTYVNLVMAFLLRAFNRFIPLHTLQTSAHAILKDESHQFRLKTYYVRPSEQLNQLAEHFSDIKVYSWKSGLEITDHLEKIPTKGNTLSENSEMWLYYLCSIR